MRSTLSGYDAWLTRCPWDYEPDIIPQPKCSVCGIFVKDEALHHVTAEDVDECSGVDDPDYGAFCAPYSWEKCPHERHFFVVSAYTVIYRRCARGHLSKEFVI